MDTYLLHGPPGVGKTTALAGTWIPRAVDKWGGSGVVVCSLTKAAARELNSRQLPIPEDNVGTLHSLCYRALSAQAGGPLEIAEAHAEEWNQEAPNYRWRLSEGDGAEEYDIDGRSQKTEGDRLLQVANCARQRMLPSDAWPDVEALEFIDAWEGWMEKHGYYDFTGLIETCWRSGISCAAAPRVLIVDEAQDSSLLEISLVRRWAAESADALILAGDSDQCIYGFRGSDPKDFAGIDVPQENHRALTQSFRVPREVHRTATAWIKQAAWRHPVDYRPRDLEGAVVQAPHINFSNRHAMADLVEALAEQETPARNKVMALATCGFMIDPLVRELRERGIPFHNPYRLKAGGWNPLRGGAARLWSFLAPMLRKGSWTYKGLWRWIECVQAEATLAPGMKALVQTQVKERPDEALTVGEVLSLFHEQDRDSFYQTWENPARAMEWLQSRLLKRHHKLFEYAFKVGARSPLALDRTPDIIVGTIHSVKGGEAAHVLLSPDISRAAAESWGTKNDNHEQTVRTFYVGMTRASESLTLCGNSQYQAVQW